MIHLRTDSYQDTQLMAATLADLVESRDLLLLSGEVGTGKTTFTQGFGRALGVSEPIISPTFVLMRSYEARLPLHHVDIYRMEQLQEVIDLALMELLDEGGVALIEWGEMAEPVLPRDYLEIRLGFDVLDDEVRHIVLRGVGDIWARREKVVADHLTKWLDPNAGVTEEMQ